MTVRTHIQVQRQSDRRRPRLHWCPTGELAFLPLHAAGIHDPRSSETLEACSDYFVSSYTPTLAALIDARRSAKPLPTGDIRALLVAEGRSPGFVPLEGVDDEIAMIQQVIQPACERTVTLQGVEQRLATMELVLEEAQKANILHLACHGVQNVQKPLQSGFALKNGMLTLSSLLSLNLSGAFMAFLSACETAKGDRDQPNQIVHLAAAMLFAGFPNVVATMW
jgi:CHAT domain-containing protein